MDSNDIAVLAYRAYGEHLGWKDGNGGAVPTFDALPPPMRDAWRAAMAKALDAQERDATPTVDAADRPKTLGK
jgi:hypothetical protein